MSAQTTPSRPHIVTPPCDELKKMLNKGMTQLQIAQTWGQKTGYEPTRSAIGNAIKRCGLESAHPRPRYADLIPDGVRNEHQTAYDARCLRWLARRRKGEKLAPADETRLNGWLRDLLDEGAVVCYGGEPFLPGWFWAPVTDKAQMVEDNFFVYDPRDDED